MKPRKQNLEPRFKPSRRFDVVPNLRAPQRGQTEERLERLKRHLVRSYQGQVREEIPPAMTMHAANEAAALAWMTPFPLLVLPILMEEKLFVMSRRLQLQQQIQHRCRASQAEVA